MTRDMTRRQFLDALERNGFKPAIIGPFYEDTTEAPGCERISFGGVYCSRRKRIHRRSTISLLIKRRKDAVAKHAKRKAKGGY